MLIRDDEDVALDQLPARPAAGRVDDRLLRRPAAAVSAELGAELAEDERGRPVSIKRLAALQDERERLVAQRAALPLAELRQIDAITAERDRVAGQCRDIDERLQALPEPARSALGRTRDEHGAERARLTAGLAAADQQLAALQTQADRMQPMLGQAATVREEHTGLERRIGELEHQISQLRDELADREVAARPAWARDLFGERPEQYKRAEHWDRGARDVAATASNTTCQTTPGGSGPSPPAARRAATGAKPIASLSRRSADSASPSTATADCTASTRRYGVASSPPVWPVSVDAPAHRMARAGYRIDG